MRIPAKQEDKTARSEEMRRLMVNYQAGEFEAFELLYEALVPRIRGVLGRQQLGFGAELEDLVQETFLQIHRSRHTYLPSKPVEPWALAIARHVYLMDRRQRKRKMGRELPTSPSDEELEARAPSGRRLSAEASLVARDSVARALSSTTGRRRVSVVLHHLWGFSFREIGRMLGVRPDTAKRRASRGVADLRQALEEREKSKQEENE